MFEWDDAKNHTNLEKHGISFESACRIFEGMIVTAVDDRTDYGEIRHNSIGVIDGIAVIVVTHTDRRGKIRIISARPAKNKEREHYVRTLQQGIER